MVMRVGQQVLLVATTLAWPAAAWAQQAGPEDLLAGVAPAPQAVSARPEPAPSATSTPVVQPLPGEPPLAAVPAIPLPDWTVGDAAALAEVIAQIDEHGLKPEDYGLSALRMAILMGPGEELNQAAGTSFAWLAEDLRDGRTPMEARRQWFIVDKDYVDSPTEGLLREALAKQDVAGVLAGLHPTHPDYAVLKAALAETPESDAARRKAIVANMDRWRWLSRDLGGQYLLTNVPEYQLRLTVNDKIIRTYRTIVGKPGRTATPQLAEIVEGVVFNPTWTVPQSIVKGEGLGARALNNPSWARANGYKAVRGANGYVSVVQQPGPGNSLGVVKLDMPNEHAIFLHDTPSKHLFDTENRAYSHGCIRTERALELGMTLAILGQGATRDEAVEISTSGEYTKVPIQKQMPVYITYFTMGVDVDGELRSFKDIYDRDAPVLASFESPRQLNRARYSSEEVIEIVDDPRIS